MKLITHLDPSQLRLGYLSCLALVAGRQLDTRQGLVDRLSRFVFQRIDAHDSRWARFMENVEPGELERITPPLDEKTIQLHEVFRLSVPDVASYPLHVLWLAQRQLPSHVGVLTEKTTERILDMARSFEILTTGYALSEKGVFLQNYVRHVAPGVEDGSPDSNPFDVRMRRPLQLFYLYALLTVDILTPFLIHEFAMSPRGDLSNAPKLIGKAAENLVRAVEGVMDITNIESIRESRTFFERVTTKGVARNQAQPRYHHLFEIQLLDRTEVDNEGRRSNPYLANEACRQADAILAPLREQPGEQQDLLDTHFFRWAAAIYGQPCHPCQDDRRRLLYFARGFEYLQREIGFTPGRTIALAGCLLAWEDGWLVEIAEMFDLLQRMAAGPWRPYLEYSGGSRLDQEFLIKIKPGLVSILERELQ